MGINELSDSLNILGGQSPFSSKGTQGDRIIYLARVESNDDRSNMGRITASIIDFNDQNGEEQPGKDRNDVLPKIAYPLFPHFVNLMPRIGELVYVMLENPKDQSSRRFYIGPLRSVKRSFSEQESTSSANNIFNENTFRSTDATNINLDDKRNIINNDYVSLKGKNDADITLKSREVLINAGFYKNKTYTENIETPCFIQLKDNLEVISENGSIERPAFSQINIVGSNINLISSNSSSRKNRTLDENGNINSSNIEFNTNPDLNTYGETAKQLHPLVLGDELVKLLKVMIRFCLNHKHTPQDKPYGTTEEINILKEYLGVDSSSENLNSAEDTGAKITEILSKNVRTN
jgi:hypothetical protein